MPLERREIRFRNEELLRAIASYGRLTPGVLPEGALQGVSVALGAQGAPAVTVLVALAVGGPGESVEVHLSSDSILELMIGFCRQEGIPMPRSASKHAAVFDSLLGLVIEHGG